VRNAVAVLELAGFGVLAMLLSQTILLNLVEELAAADAQEFGGIGAIPFRMLEGLCDHAALRLGKNVAQGECSRGLASCAARFEFEIGHLNEPSSRKDGRPRERILQLADIPRPGMSRKSLQGFFRKGQLRPIVFADASDAQFTLFGELCRRLTVPWFALVGDHDAQRDPLAGMFRTHVADPVGSLCLRGFRCLRLNTQEASPVGLSPRQVAWLRGEVDAAVAAGQRVVLFQHNYPYQIWEDFSGPGIDDWREIVQTRPIAAVFTGHTHYGQVANDGRNVFITSRSIGDPEGGPPGYTVAHLEGEDLAVTYRTIEQTGPLVLITHPRAKLLATGPRHIICQDDEIRAQAWSQAPLRGAEARIDGGEWFALTAGAQGAFSHPLAGAGLPKGEHALEVRVTDGRGQTAGQGIEFMADPTGRYTAVPMVHPAVTNTAFC
jgi:3',5'-cyclic-AMP phosphodiesterase